MIDVLLIDVLLIHGAPASGKSTLAAGLRESLGAVIEVDQLRGMVTACDWGHPRIHAAALGMALDGAVRLARAGVRPVAVVDTFAWCGHGRAQAQLMLAALEFWTITLWVEPAELVRRLEAREVGYRHVGPALELNAQALDVGDRETLIDTTALAPAEVVARAREALAGIAASSHDLAPA